MRLSFISGLLAASAVSAATLPRRAIPTGNAPALPVPTFAQFSPKPLTLEQALNIPDNSTDEEPKTHALLVSAQATCGSIRVRTEWDNLSNAQRQSFVDSIKCLMGRPRSGQFPASQNRYEDFVALHQKLTPNVHNNRKFLLWHRYYIWAFEKELQSCGLNGNLPWFDETRYAGKFSQSSIFSSQWLGAIGIGGRCVTNGQFANLAINIGPGPGNSRHCLARDGDASETINTGSAMVNACNSNGDFVGMAQCAEGGAHAWGHNGIGAVMQDVYASPGDPVFWLHHGFIDRNYRIWQNGNPSRINSISGTDGAGNPLTLNTKINIYGFQADVTIGQILDTTATTLCYKYNY